MAMSGSYWRGVRAQGGALPADRPLTDLTAELTRMLGDPDPQLREEIAVRMLVDWLTQGVYDDLLVGLGDGMATGLTVGIGERGTDSALRRTASATVLTACLARDTARSLVPAGKVLEWGDRVVAWLLTDRDLRAVVPGADALATLSASPHVGRPELTVVLDVVADRVLAPTADRFGLAEADTLARTTIAVLRRDVVGLDLLEPWVMRLGVGAMEDARRTGNAEAFLRALYTHVTVGRRPLGVRADLVLLLVDVLREINADLR
ncbi:DUF2785 domain-containing protein [Nocardioides sp. Kera G14]|uniref:DUF2785 domain-containing protein n=1 Tax=Nocardioides sp. Kera G14 TaxID=2884264 RepID=UPI001D124076|nr:DUF2785 domain-containing protein [Nocardioides sp. Kera G14]UDY24683.1 DUF2785 domain-containing protein [Nocardioides sp. Kera G14]